MRHRRDAHQHDETHQEQHRDSILFQVSHIVNNIFSSRTYVLNCEENPDVWLVDCGDVEKLPADCNVKGVLLTHAHFDHIYGLPKLLERFPDCRVVTSACGLDTMADARKNMSKYHESPMIVNPRHPLIAREGDTIELFAGVKALVYETPGHHPSCLCYRVGGHLFTGDAYIPGTPIVTNLPGGRKPQAEASLQRIMSLSQRLNICPGHEI